MTISERKTPVKILAVLTLLCALGSALCWVWAEIQTNKARNQLSEAARSGNWEAYQVMIRDEWPALDWFVASFILLVFAIVVGAITLLYWTISEKGKDEV